MKTQPQLTTLAPLLLALLSLSLAISPLAQADPQTDSKPAAQDPFAKWEKEISSLEAAAKKNPPPQQGIVFVGSSSIRRWNLASSFPNLPVINSGFGGSQLADSVHFAPRVVIPHQPRIVVLYAGDNDLNGGKQPQQVYEDYRQFVAVVRQSLPQARIIYIGIKPSLARWKLIEKVRETNKLILAETMRDENQAFIDVDGPMLGSDSKPRPELYVKDGLHLTDAGYAIWADLLRPQLKLE